MTPLVSLEMPTEIWGDLIAVLRDLEPHIEGERKRAAVRRTAIELLEKFRDLQFNLESAQ